MSHNICVIEINRNFTHPYKNKKSTLVTLNLTSMDKIPTRKLFTILTQTLNLYPQES